MAAWSVSCTNAARAARLHYPDCCTTRGSLTFHLTQQLPKPIGQSVVLPQPRRQPHEQHTRPETHATCCLHVCCFAASCVPPLPTACPGTNKGQQRRVHLIRHLSSPLLEPPVKVGSPGVLAIQLTTVGTHALQAVGPQEWPIGPIHHLLLNFWPPFSHSQRPTSTPRPNKLALLASPFSLFW